MLKLTCDIITFGLLVWVCYNAVRVVQSLVETINGKVPRFIIGVKK